MPALPGRLAAASVLCLLAAGCAGPEGLSVLTPEPPAEGSPPGDPRYGARPGQLVLIKADDVTHAWGKPGSLPPRWVQFAAICQSLDIRVTAGVIGRSLETGSEEYFRALRALAGTGRWEFFNHGYTHAIGVVDTFRLATAEFQGTPCEYQRDRLIRTQTLLREKIGVASIAFGAPGNANDGNTVCALRSIPEIRLWFDGLPGTTALTLRNSPCESPFARPNFEAFQRGFDAEARVIVLQVHPASWKSRREVSEFVRVIEFLKQRGAIFTTPSELVGGHDPEDPPPVDPGGDEVTTVPGDGGQRGEGGKPDRESHPAEVTPGT